MKSGHISFTQVDTTQPLFGSANSERQGLMQASKKETGLKLLPKKSASLTWTLPIGH
jgi:hypothetical protein